MEELILWARFPMFLIMDQSQDQIRNLNYNKVNLANLEMPINNKYNLMQVV